MQMHKSNQTRAEHRNGNSDEEGNLGIHDEVKRTERAADGALVRERDARREFRYVRAVDIRRNIGCGRGRIRTFDGHALDDGPKVTRRGIIRVIPIDHTSSPLDRADCGGVDTCGPYAELDTAGRARILWNTSISAVDCFISVDHAHYFAVD